jgi:hypothetical protein
MPLAFEQQPNESNKAFTAFSLYLSMGSERSIASVACKLAKSDQLIKRWSAKFNWQTRVTAYATHMAAIEREQTEALTRAKAVDWVTRQEEHKQVEWELRGRLVTLAKKAIGRWEKNETRCGTLEGIARLLELASKLGRLASGLATDKTEVKEEVNVSVDVEFEAALKKAYGKPLPGEVLADGQVLEAEVVTERPKLEAKND